MSRKALGYKVALRRSDEGCSVSVPDLPGCFSQGATEAEALANVADAIREYLTVAENLVILSAAKDLDDH
jgi:predicted RNase H-like HicB family nuclease